MRRALLFFISISAAHAAIVKWLPDASINLAINFKYGKLPCPKQTVVFPETDQVSVVIKEELAVAGLILPTDGDLVLDSGHILFGGESATCTDEGKVFFYPKSVSSWAEPGVWASPRFNKATPDAERVPCYDDVAEFPSSKTYSVKLPERQQSLQGIIVNGKRSDINRFNDDIHTRQYQGFILNSYGDTGLRQNSPCDSKSGCPCQSSPLEIDCSRKYCEVPQCLEPVKPIGSCCEICGGYSVMTNIEALDYAAFKKTVLEIIESYGEENFIYHIGRLPEGKVQVVIMDKGEYNGKSAEVVHALERHFRKQVGFVASAQFSGNPLSKAGLGGKILISMFFAVVLVMGAVYLYYYKTPKMPEFRYPTGLRGVTGVMSRFSRRSDSVVSLTRRASTATIGSVGGTGFRNPLYDSRRGRVVVEETVMEE